jgi:hypothetical protein
VFLWFERKGQFVPCEILQVPTGGFELRFVEPDGTEVVERFDASWLEPSEPHASETLESSKARSAGPFCLPAVNP